jgi:hypothetical protein
MIAVDEVGLKRILRQLVDETKKQSKREIEAVTDAADDIRRIVDAASKASSKHPSGVPVEKSSRTRRPTHYAVPRAWSGGVLPLLNRVMYRHHLDGLLTVLTPILTPLNLTVLEWWVGLTPADRDGIWPNGKERNVILEVIEWAILRDVLEGFTAAPPPLLISDPEQLRQTWRATAALKLYPLDGRATIPFAVGETPRPTAFVSRIPRALVRVMLMDTEALARLRRCLDPRCGADHRCRSDKRRPHVARAGGPFFIDQSSTWSTRFAVGCCETHRQQALRKRRSTAG